LRPPQNFSPAPAGLLFPIPPISHCHSRALPESDLCLCGSVGGDRRLEVVDTGNMGLTRVSARDPMGELSPEPAPIGAAQGGERRESDFRAAAIPFLRFSKPQAKARFSRCRGQ
jgi:hypothetical protein